LSAFFFSFFSESSSCQQKERITKELAAFTNTFILELQSKIKTLHEKHRKELKSLKMHRRKSGNDYTFAVLMSQLNNKE